jgi:hypothetical protein
MIHQESNDASQTDVRSLMRGWRAASFLGSDDDGNYSEKAALRRLLCAENPYEQTR